MNKNPDVSFVIRTKNEEKFIGRVLNLLQKQTHKNFEIIIIDSGSTDKTLEIIRRFPTRLIEIRPSDFNFSYALNMGISKAKGKYIAIISGHSIPITDTWLEDSIKLFKDKKVAAISGYYSEIPVGYFWRSLGRIFFSGNRQIKDFDPWMTNSNAIIRKELWEEYHFDETLPSCEDYDWAKEMLFRGYNIVKYRPFSVFHSHFLLGRPGYYKMLPKWKKWANIVDKKKRISKS